MAEKTLHQAEKQMILDIINRMTDNDMTLEDVDFNLLFASSDKDYTLKLVSAYDTGQYIRMHVYYGQHEFRIAILEISDG